MGLDVRRRKEGEEAGSEDVRVSLEEGRPALETAELISAKENKAFFLFSPPK